MPDGIAVPVELLQSASRLLLDYLQSVEGETVLLDKDYFWAISPEQAFDVYVEPTQFTVGQLTECVANLERIVGDPSQSTSFGLVWLADLLRATGQTVIR